MVLHDYVLDPVPSVPIINRGNATFDELREVFADSHCVALVGSEDPDMGPYTHCIRADAVDIDAFHGKGYRSLSRSEEDAVSLTPNDFGDATD